MSVARFYCPLPIQDQTDLVLPPAIAQHASRALRLRAGDPIILFDGQGGQWQATLQFEAGTAIAHGPQHQAIERELSGPLGLAQGLAQGDKMDWIIEKAVELGIQDFYPIAAQRSTLQLQGERLHKRYQRWNSIIQSASEQCGRNQLMRLHPLVRVTDFHSASPTQLLLCHPTGTQHLQQITPRANHQVILCIGPEGGWSEQECQQWQHLGAVTIHFGQRILRTETAGIALSSACATLWGWNH